MSNGVRQTTPDGANGVPSRQPNGEEEGMSDMHERAAAELHAIVAQYSAGEAEVVTTYFQQQHTDEENLDVLLRQMGRELQTSNWLHNAVKMLEELDVTVDRHEFAGFLEHIAEETEHYCILADLAEWYAGRKLGPQELHK